LRSVSVIGRWAEEADQYERRTELTVAMYDGGEPREIHFGQAVEDREGLGRHGLWPEAGGSIGDRGGDYVPWLHRQNRRGTRRAQ